MISIVMNCHNCAAHVPAAIESVLNQSEQNWELIFWDNASTDCSRKIVKSYGDNRIKYFHSEKYCSLGAARNSALMEAKGEFIAFLDTDDHWTSNKLSLQVKALSENKNAGITYTDACIVSDGKVTKRVFSKKEPPQGQVFEQLLSDYFLVMSSVMIRRACLDTQEYWFDDQFEIIEEYDLFLRISTGYELVFTPNALTYWRLHHNSTTMQKRNRIAREKRKLLKNLHRHFPILLQKHSASVRKVKGKVLLTSAIAKYYSGSPKEARKLLLKSNKVNLKGLFVYFASYFPPSVIDYVYRRLKGNPLV